MSRTYWTTFILRMPKDKSYSCESKRNILWTIVASNLKVNKNTVWFKGRINRLQIG